jgi:hypothetical protein
MKVLALTDVAREVGIKATMRYCILLSRLSNSVDSKTKQNKKPNKTKQNKTKHTYLLGEPRAIGSSTHSWWESKLVTVLENYPKILFNNINICII